MKIEELEKEARKASLTPRQYCLREIIVWKDRLRAVSDDYRGLDGKEFAERVEREVDSFIREESERNNE